MMKRMIPLMVARANVTRSVHIDSMVTRAIADFTRYKVFETKEVSNWVGTK